MAGFGRSYIEYDAEFGGFFTKKHKGRPFRAKMFSESRYSYRKGGYGPPHSHFEDRDGELSMSETYTQHVQYGRVGRRRPEKFGNMKGKRHMDTHSDRSYNKLDGSGDKNTFFKVTIPHGEKYKEDWLINTLQKACGVDFTPMEYHLGHSRAHFYVKDLNAAKALRRVSGTLKDRQNFKIVVLTRPCIQPFKMKAMKDEDLEHFKNCMQKRYDGSQMALDMKALRSEPDLVENNVDLILNRRYNMNAMLQIIQDNVPELLSLDVSSNKLFQLDTMSSILTKAPNLKNLNLSNNCLKSDRELDKIKGLKLEELWLEGNPLCDAFREKNLYISAVRERFPKLLRLDGHELPPPISFDVETPTVLPSCKDSCFENDDIKVIVLRFLQQYYTYYDGEDRQGLLNVYHDEACCSFTTGPNHSKHGIGDYLKISRNLKKVKEPAICHKLLKHKRLNVVGFLNDLPRTKHDLNSFVVDVHAQSSTLLCFVVNGVFREVKKNTFWAFTRVFIAVPGSDAGLLLVNDELFIRNATADEMRKAFATADPIPSSSPVPALTHVPHDMVQAFILFSGMNSDWSTKCLQDNDWDFDQAAQIFLNLQGEGKIPDVAFIK